MVTIDTNVAFYALATEGPKADRAKDLLESAGFLSVQVLNEYANAVRRKLDRAWADIDYDLELLRNSVANVHSVRSDSNREACRLAARYKLSFFDALLIAVALANGATTLYSEDMHNGLVIDGTLTITNPFPPTEPA